MDILESELHSTYGAGVYIYRPGKPKPDSGRSSKRRKVNTKDNENIQCPFVPLLNGDENTTCAGLRYHTYERLWSAREKKIQEILDNADSDILDSVFSFVKTASSEAYNGNIPAALVTIGSNVPSFNRLLRRLHEQLTATKVGGVVVLESGDASNLKSALRNIIRSAVNTEGNDGYQKFLSDRDGPQLLGYDLSLLSEYVKKRGVTKVVLAFRDSEAFDLSLLSDLLPLLSSWLDRIPFVLLFGIFTSAELFEGSLPRPAAAKIRGECFEIHETSSCVDRIYESLQFEDDGSLWLGRNVTSLLFEKSNDIFQSPESFTRMVKYAYMSHFFANSLSLLLASDVPTNMSYDRLCEAIRNLPSFRTFCEELLDHGVVCQVNDLLESDEVLLRESAKHLGEGQRKMRAIFQAVRVIHRSAQNLKISGKRSMTNLSLHALSGELLDGPVMNDVFTAIKKLDSHGLENFLTALPESVTADHRLQEIQNDLKDLIQMHQSTGPLWSEYDHRFSFVKAAVAQQKVRLSKGKAKMSQQNIEYTKIVDRVCAMLHSYLSEILVKPQDLFLHEVFVFDVKTSLKEAFGPRPRFAIERALSRPFDYLISTTDTAVAGISARQPATAVVYQLCLESGALVNVHDLWQTFHAVFESDVGENYDEQMTMGLFYRALSELKAFGIIKGSRRSADHIAKSAWIGL